MANRRQPFTDLIRTPAAFTCADTYGTVPGSDYDSLLFGSKFISWDLKATTQDVTAKIQGSIDGATWVDLRLQDNTGAAFGAVDIAISQPNHVQAFMNDDSITNSPNVIAGYRFYRVQAKNTVGGSVGVLTSVMIAK